MIPCCHGAGDVPRAHEPACRALGLGVRRGSQHGEGADLGLCSAPPRAAGTQGLWHDGC